MFNMYEFVGYEIYGEYDIFENEMEVKFLVEGFIFRGWMLYEYENLIVGLEFVCIEFKMILLVIEENLVKGVQLYEIYCVVCYGMKGDG